MAAAIICQFNTPTGMPTCDAVGHLLAVLQEHVLADDLCHKEPLRQLAHNVLAGTQGRGRWEGSVGGEPLHAWCTEQ